MQHSLLVGEHPPRLTAPRSEDPWGPGYVKHPERWEGAETAHREKVAVNLKNAVEATLSGGMGPWRFATRVGPVT
jgi:hypothetical protein